jgi:hypothetical protein
MAAIPMGIAQRPHHVPRLSAAPPLIQNLKSKIEQSLLPHDFDLELGAFCRDNAARERTNTVQQLAVNLADAEPCPSRGAALLLWAAPLTLSAHNSSPAA